MILKYGVMFFFITLCLIIFSQCAKAAQVTLSWQDNADNEDGFYIERKDPGSTTFIRIATVPALVGKSPPRIEYVDTGLLPLSIYSWRIRAFNSAGQSLPSSIASTKTQADFVPVPLPTPPTLPEAKPSNP